MAIATLEALFQHELRDLYSAEEQIVKALPQMIAASTNTDLQAALQEHLTVTQEQLARLDRIANENDLMLGSHTCKGMAGIIAEGKETLEEIVDPTTKDAAIIVSAQRVEHYEMGAYGGAIAFAKELGYDDMASELHTTLEEEIDADKKLSRVAEGGLFKAGVNEVAAEESSVEVTDL